MSITVAIISFNRRWALEHALNSLLDQTKPPNEVLIVLKPSLDKSEALINTFSGRLPIRCLLQHHGNLIDAYHIAIQHAIGDIVLFLDDDAIASKTWVACYSELFEKNDNAGGIYGIIYKSFINDAVHLTNEFSHAPFIEHKPCNDWMLHVKPMTLFLGYSSWISAAGRLIYGSLDSNPCKSAGMIGANMGMRKKTVVDLPLSELYLFTKKGIMIEQLLAYYIRHKGSDIYFVNDAATSPIIWHSEHKSLSRSNDFTDKMWVEYDLTMFFWRLKALGGEVSLIRYIFGTIYPIRRSFPSIFGMILGTIKGITFYLIHKINRS